MYRVLSRTSFNNSNLVRRAATINNQNESSSNYAKSLFDSLIKGDRGALARCITLVESSLKSKKRIGDEILLMVMRERRKSNALKTFRIGLSGPPGAGKSTFIEAFGNYIIKLNHKVAVLAVDPSSKSSGGSLMGDKTRMPELTLNPKAYIRPSPSSGTLGGVARNTNEALVLCEGAGYDIVLVETIGVGQSEFAVADMVDMFCLVLPPAGGDELQGLKRGIIEVADMIIVNKFDGDLMPAVRRVAAEYTSALKFIRKRHPLWKPKVMKVSSLNRTGFDELWQTMCSFQEVQESSGRLEKVRQEQRIKWLWGHVKDDLMEQFENDRQVKLQLMELESQVRKGTISSGSAADLLLAVFRRGANQNNERIS